MPYYYGMFGNKYYMLGTILVMLAAVFAMYAQMKVQTTYALYKKVENSRHITGAQVAREILDHVGLYEIRVYEVKGTLSDHYHPTQKTINLSSDIYHGTTIAALSVAAHECGHAIQHQEKYLPISLRNAILPFVNVGQYLGWIAILLGLAFGHTNLAWAGFIGMCGILAFQVITLPVELNASSRALKILQVRYLDENELQGARRMLSAAALTYVAAMVSTLMSMFRIFLMILGNQRDD